MAKSLRDCSKILIGAGEIMQYLKCNKDLMKTFLESGMPANKIRGRWYAHIDNIDRFFQVVTRTQAELSARINLSDGDINEDGNGNKKQNK